MFTLFCLCICHCCQLHLVQCLWMQQGIMLGQWGTVKLSVKLMPEKMTSTLRSTAWCKSSQNCSANCTVNHFCLVCHGNLLKHCLPLAQFLSTNSGALQVKISTQSPFQILLPIFWLSQKKLKKSHMQCLLCGFCACCCQNCFTDNAPMRSGGPKHITAPTCAQSSHASCCAMASFSVWKKWTVGNAFWSGRAEPSMNLSMTAGASLNFLLLGQWELASFSLFEWQLWAMKSNCSWAKRANQSNCSQFLSLCSLIHSESPNCSWAKVKRTIESNCSWSKRSIRLKINFATMKIWLAPNVMVLQKLPSLHSTLVSLVEPHEMVWVQN